MPTTKSSTPTVDTIVASLRADTEKLVQAALEEIATLSEAAEQQQDRYLAARTELTEARSELDSLTSEYEALPASAYKANLDDDAFKEEELRARYREVRERIPALQTRVSELVTECDSLCSGSARANPTAGASLLAHAPAYSKAREAAESLQKLREDISEVLDQTTEPLRSEAESLSALTESLSDQVQQAFNARGFRDSREIPSHADMEDQPHE